MWLMMATMMNFLGSCWAWPPHMLPRVVLGSYTFTTDGITTSGSPYSLPSIAIYNMQENIAALFHNSEIAGGTLR